MENSNDIDLDQFINEMQQRLDKFKHYWQMEQKKDPDAFPSKMLAGDWDEQFNFFDEEWDNQEVVEQAL
ncbi:hypothetical protein [Photobacterium leiognathi]|uniref:hypothetical protein n=1 Tax=Photobacterium leiognathi TaxID=553611 RepID=UPI002980CD33|nr:hypothetical protein [Photobacterium leiognathi]